MSNESIVAILIALIGIIPGILAYRSARKTKKSVQLAGSDTTVANWNKLIKNLYEEIDRLQALNDLERKRAKAREAELQAEIEATKAKAAAEKKELLGEIAELKRQILQLEKRVTAKLKDDENFTT